MNPETNSERAEAISHAKAADPVPQVIPTGLTGENGPPSSTPTGRDAGSSDQIAAGRRLNWIIFGACVIIFGGGYLLFGATLTAKLDAAEQKPPETAPEVFKVTADTITVPLEASKTLGLQTLVAEPRRVPITLRLTGRTGLNNEQVSHVHAQFSGRVVELGPPLGSTVTGPNSAGGPSRLLVIESTDLAGAKGDYIKSKVQLEVDLDTLRRTEELVKATVLADKFLQDAKSAVKKSQADQDQARQKLLIYGLKDLDLEKISGQEGRERMVYSINSPRAGVVTEKNVTLGELTDPTLNLFTIADLSKLWIWGDVYERDRRRIKEGQKMKVIVASHPDEPRECTIEWISPVLDANTRSIRVRGSLDNQDGRLLADMYSTLIVTLDDKSDSILMPTEAVIRKGDLAYAFVLTGNGDGATTYQRRAVKVERLGSGIGFEIGESSTTRPVTATVDGKNGESRSALPELLRVVEGIKTGDIVVIHGGLGLINEMEQQAAK